MRIIALRALGNGAAAADIAQEAVARAMASLAANGSREIGDLGAFIYGIARHLIADARRADTRIVDIESVDEPADATAGALDAVVAAEDTARMYLAIEQLSERDRDLLRLSFFEELEVHEIAARLGDNAVNVRQRKSRALARLRRLFLDCHEPG